MIDCPDPFLEFLIPPVIIFRWHMLCHTKHLGPHPRVHRGERGYGSVRTIEHMFERRHVHSPDASLRLPAPAAAGTLVPGYKARPRMALPLTRGVAGTRARAPGPNARPMWAGLHRWGGRAAKACPPSVLASLHPSRARIESGAGSCGCPTGRQLGSAPLGGQPCPRALFPRPPSSTYGGGIESMGQGPSTDAGAGKQHLSRLRGSPPRRSSTRTNSSGRTQ